MKICFLLLLILLVAGCQSPDNNQGTHQTRRAATATYTNARIDNEPPLHIASLSVSSGAWTKEQTEAVAKKRQTMIDRLWQVSPIPVPGLTNTEGITAEVAHERYVNFIKSHTSDSILPLFQQRYARILLTNYHWLETGRADVIAFYVDQLLVAHSADVKTIADGLVRLQDKLPTTQFTSLVARALPGAEEQLMAEQHLLSEMEYWKNKTVAKTSLPSATASYRAMMLTKRDRELSVLKKRYREDSTNVVRLRSLPLG